MRYKTKREKGNETDRKTQDARTEQPKACRKGGPEPKRIKEKKTAWEASVPMQPEKEDPRDNYHKRGERVERQMITMI